MPLKHLEIFRRTGGGVFFKRRNAGFAISAAWFLLETTSNCGLGGDQAIAKVLKIVECSWDYGDCKPALPGEAIQAEWNSFQQWRTVPETAVPYGESFGQILRLVDAFQAIACFEADFALPLWQEKDRDPKSNPKNNLDVLRTQLKDWYQRQVEVRSTA